MPVIPEKLSPVIQSLPELPGVYQYYDKDNTIIYVGKAKNLKKRVASYFRKDHESGKTELMVRKIAAIRTIVVNSELDALLLENNLIKKYQPKYNVMLKDDKTYPWICIKNERFPRIFSTRKMIRDGSQYFGPYPSGRTMHILLDLIAKLYPLRNCNYHLTDENIRKKKFKVCLEYHIGNCKGPCEGLQDEKDYDRDIGLIREIVKGNFSSALRGMKEKMKEYSEKLEFEKAQALKERIDLLDNYCSRSAVVSPVINNVDVCSIATDEKSAYANFLKVMNGAIVQGHTIEFKKKLDETKEELFDLAIIEFRQRYHSEANEVIVPFKPGTEMPGVEFIVPQRGDKKKLLELSERNVFYFRKEKEKQESLIDPERHSKRILATMMKDLRMKEEPKHIECFDNSNFQGDHAVAAMTVFRNAKPSKKEYRHFNIRSVSGPDDFASMEEVILRRYKRVLDEKLDLPQLIVIDGGKGQLSSALESLKKLELTGKVAVIGIAKKLEEIYYPEDPLPLYLDKRSETLRILQQLRDEAHRFGITHHRKKRSKSTIRTELNDIAGISDLSSEKLLRQFRSVKKIKECSEKELAVVIGKAKAKLVFGHFRK